MHYSYQATVTTAHTSTAPLVTSMKLGAGVLRHVDITFPSGCNRAVRCTIFDRAKQLFPTNQQGFYSEENQVVSFDCYHDMSSEDNQLYFIAWGVNSSYSHVLSCRLDVQGPDEPDINKFIPQLIQLMGRMVDWLKAVY